MYTITQQGVVDGQYNAQLNSNFSEVSGGGSGSGDVSVDVWVRPQASGTSQLGTWDNPFGSMALARPAMEPGVVIGLEGVLLEEFSSPIISDITIVGAKSNVPRQATTSGVPNGGGATWMGPSGGTGTLLTVNGQSWKLQNIFMNNASTTAGTACVKVMVSGTGDPPVDPDGSMFWMDSCWLTGAVAGLTSSGLPNYCRVTNNRFFSFAGAGDLAITYAVGAGAKTLSGWEIMGNRFLGNAGHITAAFASAEIAYNYFSYIWQSTTSTTQVVLTSGANNSVHDNTFAVPFNVNGLTAMFAAGTNDRWAANAMGTAVLTPMTGVLWGVPVSGAA